MPSEPTNRPEPPAGADAIWAPWRLRYLEGEGDDAPTPEPTASTAPSDTGCFLSDAWANPDRDEANLVVRRGEHGLIMLNRYPYSNGHLLVAIGEPRSRLLDYTPEQRAELWQLVDTAADLMERALEPQGINIGINQGRAAGAGVPQHLHVHLVPRWGGDVNFMTTVGRIRVVPSSLEQMLERYRMVVGSG